MFFIFFLSFRYNDSKNNFFLKIILIYTMKNYNTTLPSNSKESSHDNKLICYEYKVD
jgi:hypothetical protein